MDIDTQHDGVARVFPSFISIQIVLFNLFRLKFQGTKMKVPVRISQLPNWSSSWIILAPVARGAVHFLRPFLNTAFKEVGFIVRISEELGDL